MQRRRTLLISDAGALFGSKACQSAAVSQWSCLVRGWAAPFLHQFSNTPALNAARASPIGCVPARRAQARAAAHQRRHPDIGGIRSPGSIFIGVQSHWMCAAHARARARVAAHQTCQAHARVGYAALAACSPGVAPRRRRNTQPGQHLHQKAQPDIAGVRSPGKQIHQTRR